MKLIMRDQVDACYRGVAVDVLTRLVNADDVIKWLKSDKKSCLYPK